MAATSSATNKKASFRWKPEMIEQLITCLHQYKTAMSYKNLDFDADKPIQYKELRLKMATLFENENVSLFGSVNPLLPPENFDSLPKDEQSKPNVAGGGQQDNMPNVAGGGQQDNIFSNKSSSDLEEPTPKRIKSSCVPQLVDDKRKHLEKRLSAAQRDNLLVKEAKDDAQFKKDLCQAMRESTASFSESIKEISNSMTGIGNGICRSIEMLLKALLQQNQNNRPVSQNLFYQNEPMFHPTPGVHHTQAMNEISHSQSSLGSYGSQNSQLPHYTNLR
eukprot:gene11557-12747_t